MEIEKCLAYPIFLTDLFPDLSRGMTVQMCACENSYISMDIALDFCSVFPYTTLIMSWQSSNSEVNRAKNSCNAEQPPSSKIYNVYKIVYKEKQDTLVTITKLKVSPGTCLATYGDSCSSTLCFLGSAAPFRRQSRAVYKTYLHFREKNIYPWRKSLAI